VNTLSIWTYYRRHKRRAALLSGLTALVTAGLYMMVALLWTAWIEPGRMNLLYLSRFSVVSPQSGQGGPDPAVVAQIRANQDVAQVIPAMQIWIQIPGLMTGDSMGFWLHGLMEGDLQTVIEQCGGHVITGMLPEPNSNGLLLSRDVATSLGVGVGNSIDESINSELFGNIVTPLEVVGILESDVRLGLLSLEYLSDHEFYSGFSPQFLVIARKGREITVDEFLRSKVQSAHTHVQTLQMLNEAMKDEYLQSLIVLVPIVVFVTIAFSLVIGAANWIEFTRRLPEFGILHAVGHSRKTLIRQLTRGTAAPALAGWGAGIGLSMAILSILNATLFQPAGNTFSLSVLIGAMSLAIPIPAALIGLTLFGARRILSTLDPVTIVERGQETERKASKGESRSTGSSLKPLASATFFRRHRNRAALLIGAMSLTIVAVAMTIFLLAASSDAREPGTRYLNRLSIVRSPTISLDPAVVAAVRTHPAVERVIPVAPRFHMIGISIPPFVVDEASPFGVYTEDMAYLVELYGLELKEGHLPRPRTNELVIPEILAQNRDLQIGDLIGDPDRPAYTGEESLPAEFVVSGIFARSSIPEDDNWLGFVSLEFLESHEEFPIPDSPPLMVVPKDGQKESLDDWLEGELAGRGVWVTTYRQELARLRGQTRNQILSLAILESVIALVAALALAVLNQIFFSQRKSEFGLLHALGFGRPRLVWRTMQETLFTTATAWLSGAVVCLLGLIYLQVGAFSPLGLKLDLFYLTPWLLTLPIPIATVAVVTASAARTLSRLDPVSVIERRIS
jgi:ABC-type lipoprotein release transport system permease subunit